MIDSTEWFRRFQATNDMEVLRKLLLDWAQIKERDGAVSSVSKFFRQPHEILCQLSIQTDEELRRRVEMHILFKDSAPAHIVREHQLTQLLVQKILDMRHPEDIRQINHDEGEISF